jgi:hypothetical protein
VFAAPADLIEALSCVFRAGRQGANTDHSSILFDVDVKTGEIKEGSTNEHWYKLGLNQMFKCSWRSTYLTKDHPDCGKKIAGACSLCFPHDHGPEAWSIPFPAISDLPHTTTTTTTTTKG